MPLPEVESSSTSLALRTFSRTEFEVLGLASNPASPRNCLVLVSDLLVMGQGHDHFLFVLEHAKDLAENF